MPAPTGEQLGAQPVDEDDDRASGGTKGAIARLRQTGHAQAGRDGGQDPVQPRGGRQEGRRLGAVVRHAVDQCPMLAERSRANSIARSSATRPSASALMRRAMSSLVIVPS